VTVNPRTPNHNTPAQQVPVNELHPSPIEASSGKTTRHRLNRGGDRQANAALYRIVLVRLCYDQATRDYMARRIKEGKSKKEIIRCLKRYVAREVFAVLQQMRATDSTKATWHLYERQVSTITPSPGRRRAGAL